MGSDFSTHRCRILFWTSLKRRAQRSSVAAASAIGLSRGCDLWQDQREAAERLREEAAERVHANAQGSAGLDAASKRSGNE